MQSILGQTAIAIGATGSKPQFLMPGQLLKIPIRKHDTTGSVHTLTNNEEPGSANNDEDYIVVRIISVVTAAAANPVAEACHAYVKVVRGISAGVYEFFSLPGGTYNSASS